MELTRSESMSPEDSSDFKKLLGALKRESNKTGLLALPESWQVYILYEVRSRGFLAGL